MMPDMEKVVEGLRCIKGDLILCVDCAYSDGNGHGTYSCKAFCANDAIELLKEHEAVEPKTTITYNGFHYDYCGNCGRLLPVAQDFEKANYCPSCGRSVKHDA